MIVRDMWLPKILIGFVFKAAPLKSKKPWSVGLLLHINIYEEDVLSPLYPQELLVLPDWKHGSHLLLLYLILQKKIFFLISWFVPRGRL